ncbi:MAG: ABC transporter substrate-binding protein [Candidatus Omnitrophica bacterium]|nr:ABC transporter substrate-binding protein [Candidatus Omnitrophota bacterium]MBU1929124.1 ABC transporter substrate-binding protein [Candidatus Omnitrophota bacterium]MBU1929125.1 ABC transporter substrate-binding protein [Candidatus Omnitrophota bacterium]
MLKQGIVVVVVLAICLGLCSIALAQEKIKIGIVLTSNASHYLDTQKGILDQFEKSGYGKDKVDFNIQFAENNKDKMLAIVNEFQANKVNLIIAVGTPAAIVASQAEKNIPVVFSLVFDPISSKIAKDWGSSGNNTTGTSTMVDMAAIINAMRKITKVVRLGVIYTEGEANTTQQLAALQKIQETSKITVIAANLAKAEDATAVANSLIGKVDAIFITGGTTVTKALTDITTVAKNNKIMTVAHMADRAKQGVLLCVSSSSYMLGQLSTKKAIQILNGKRPAELPIELLKQYDITINNAIAKASDIKVPASMLSIAKNIIE